MLIRITKSGLSQSVERLFYKTPRRRFRPQCLFVCFFVVVFLLLFYLFFSFLFSFFFFFSLIVVILNYCKMEWNSHGAELPRLTSWRYATNVTQTSVNKERYWLTPTLLHFTARPRSHNWYFFFIEKWTATRMLVSSQAIAIKNTYSMHTHIHTHTHHHHHHHHHHTHKSMSWSWFHIRCNYSKETMTISI